MKIRTSRADLADALTWVTQAISKRPVVPVLSGIRITVTEGQMTLHAFDYETAHTAVVEAEVASDGDCLVNGQFLREVITALRGEDVELVLDGDRLAISVGRSAYQARAMVIEDYPHLPVFPGLAGQVEHADLAEIVSAAEHAASRDLDQGIRAAVHLIGTTAGLIVETTDNYRAARAEAVWEPEHDFSIIVPTRPLVTALKGMAGGLKVGVEGGLFGLMDGSRTVTTRLFDGEFPNIARLFPTNMTVVAEVDAADLSEAVKRASLAADGEHRAVYLAITPGEVTVTAESETGEGSEHIPCDADGDFGALLNGRYLSDALLATPSTRVRLGFTGQPGEVKPMVLKPLDHQHVSLLIMPRRKP